MMSFRRVVILLAVAVAVGALGANRLGAAGSAAVICRCPPVAAWTRWSIGTNAMS